MMHDELAKKLRLETARLEKGDFAVKKAMVVHADTSLDDDPGDDEPAISQADIDEFNFLNPTFDDQLNRGGSSLTGYSIMEEIEEDRLHGTLAPFVEGTPIGHIQNHKRGPAPMLKTEKELYEERQKELLELRAKNDAEIYSILNRR